MLIGEIAEIMVFDRALPKAEQEKIEGYLAHKWDVVDDLAQTGFEVIKGLRLYYPFNETDGSMVQDFSTEMRHAEVVDANLQVDGKFGSGIDFYTVDDAMLDPFWARVNLEENELKLNQGSWTLSTWFEAPLTSDGVNFFHAPAYGDASSGFVFIENYSEDFINFEPGRLGINPGGTAPDKFTSYSANTLSSGWHHLVVKSSVGKTVFFIDGVEVDDIPDHFNLEVSSVGNSFVGGFKFAPKMDYFLVYDRSLSEE